MQVATNKRDLQSALQTARDQKQSIAFVPTMGNLHDGHISLVKQAKNLADVVVVSIFVNPMQFGANEDLDTYPRTIDEDKAKLVDVEANLLFLPTVTEMYPNGIDNHTQVAVPALADTLCGVSRPQFFGGVATVVTKLFNLVQPDMAVFGKKDYQQLTVIKRMSSDLCQPITIIGGDTVRESDGLAMSSRNQYLTTEERSKATLIYQLLNQTKQHILDGASDISSLEADASRQLAAESFEVDYFTIRDRNSLAEVSSETAAKEMVIFVAAKLGATRLIDNMEVQV